VASVGYGDGQSALWGGDVGPNPTDRAKNGVKRSGVTDGEGGPLGGVIAGANVVDAQLLKRTLEAIVVERPEPSSKQPQHLCLDQAYDDAHTEAEVLAQGYVPHIRRKRETPPPQAERRYPPRRWVVERTFAWLSKCRAILVRYDKQSENYLGLLQFACALLWYRRLARLKTEN
jgi:putative transposase